MKLVFSLSFVLLVAAFLTAQQNPNKQADRKAAESSKVPTQITLVLEVTELSGSETAGSFWEGTYELRVADWSEVVEKTKAGDTGNTGEILVRSSFPRRALNDKDHRRIEISIPVEGLLLDRLQRESLRAQAFLLRSKIRAYDGKLDQNYVFELNRIWQSAWFPEGEAKIAISLKPDGGYNTWGPAPKQLPPGFTTIGRPASSSTRP